MIRRVLRSGKLREARRRVAQSPSPSNYAHLAQEYVFVDDVREALRVCEEGLALFPGNSDLARQADRARMLMRESRLQELKTELEVSPRPAVWRELCELLLEAGQIERSEHQAAAWVQARPGEGEALLALARARVERFFADRGREAGQRALDSVEAAQEALAADARPWRLRYQFMCALGAWRDARRCTARMLELAPGDHLLESRYRSLASKEAGAPDVVQALREVERTGRLHLENADDAARDTAVDARPALRDLADQLDVEAALYLRGGTALVQGPKGATAERLARSVRGVVQSSRTVARQVGLGRVHGLRLEGDFGTLGLALGEGDAAGVWCRGALSSAHAAALEDLAGSNAATDGGVA